VTTLARIDASIRIDGSISRELADAAEQTWRSQHPGAEIIRRDLGTDPLSADLWPVAVSGAHVPAEQRTPVQVAAASVAAELADELIAADAVIVSTPLYNFGVSQHLKTWVDLTLTDPRLAPGFTDDPLSGKPLILAVARGGGYSPGTPREGWDHATPWLERIFTDVLKMDLRLAAAELTLADVTPAMEPLRDLAAESRRAGVATAAEHGTTVAQAVTATTTAAA
jgi:FMN-dependent NADH-azoreductase